MGAKKYSSREKAAILLLGFGEEVSSEIFKHMSESEISTAAASIQRIGKVTQNDVDLVMLEFYETLQSQKNHYQGDSNYTQKVLKKAFGQEKGEEISNAVASPPPTLESIKSVDAQYLSRIIVKEHPQTIALILAHTDPLKAGEVLSLLDESIRTDIIVRIAHLDTVTAEIIEEIDDHLKSEISKSSYQSGFKRGGSEKAAKILSALDPSLASNILENLEERNSELSENIRKDMFQFEDILRVDDAGIRFLIKQFPKDKLMLALRVASETSLNKFTSNMSERAAELFKDDLQSMPKQKVWDCEAAQSELAELCRGFIDEGKVVIQSDDDLYV